MIHKVLKETRVLSGAKYQKSPYTAPFHLIDLKLFIERRT